MRNIKQVFLWLMACTFMLTLSGFTSVSQSKENNRIVLADNTEKQQQGNVVNGLVTDVNGEALPGASIIEKGTKNGTVTDVNGNFSLTIVSKNNYLAISYIGYTAKEVSIGNNTNFTIILMEDSKALEEIVVVGYGIQQKRDLTGSISKVKGESVKNMPVPSVSNALQGRMSGVDFINSSGAPSAQPSIRIRGTGTINGAEPLVVIDGVPSGSIADINPNDIESVEVLKDASSSAIYGTRAANGVIIVTTKRGEKNSDVRAELNLYSAFSNVYKQLDLLTAPDLAMLKRERYTSDGINVAPFWNDTYYATQRTNWQDEIFDQGLSQNGDFRLSGGNRNSNYMTSISFYDEKGILYSSKYKRISIRANSDHQINDRLKISQSFQFTNSLSSTPYTLNAHVGRLWEALRFNPAIPVKDETGKWGSTIANNELGDINNPIYELETEKDDYTTNSILATLNLSYKFLEGLYLNVSGSANGYITLHESFLPKVTEQTRQRSLAELSKSYTQALTSLGEAYLSYLKTFDIHKVNLTGGVSYQSYSGQDFGATRRNFSDEKDEQLVFDNGAEMAAISGNFHDEVKLASAYARAFYSLKDKYMLTATFRADGSSRFAPGKRWGYFPAFSLGWRLSEEGFLNKPDFLNDLKILGGWGSLGNQDVGAFQYYPLMRNGQGQYIFGSDNALGSTVIMLANPNITWEKTDMTNLSVEARMLDNKLNATATYFYKRTYDMLIPTTVMGTQGTAGVPASNMGEMSNKGWEFDIGYTNRDNKDFSYYVSANVTFVKNKVEKLYGSDDTFIEGAQYGRQWQIISRTYEGQAIASFYGWKTDGLYQNQSEIDSDPNIKNDSRKSAIKPGDVRFVDINGDGIIDDQDRTKIGDPNPNAILGLQLGATYKGFDISTNFYGNFGLELFNADRMQGLDPAMVFNMYAETLDRWHGEGTSNTIPRMSTVKLNQNHRTSDLFIENGSFFKLKNLTIGYTLPTGILSKAKISNLRFYISGEDLLILTKYKGYSPELGYSDGNRQRGVDLAHYPTVRKVSLGLSLNF
ncbi:MAG: TonB-dependent receptor [Candidatus Symbiothrix sp.]|jgi:TonB-linked SusC/RagA family outer membrane protein|nr:TonB-dependent receptor [Candidatus Symbiothrix sp.]